MVFSRFALSLFVLFGTTLSVFPSVIVLITSQYRYRCNVVKFKNHSGSDRSRTMCGRRHISHPSPASFSSTAATMSVAYLPAGSGGLARWVQIMRFSYRDICWYIDIFICRYMWIYRSAQSQGTGGQSIILLLSLLRTGFVPLFMLCNAAPDVRFWSASLWWKLWDVTWSSYLDHDHAFQQCDWHLFQNRIWWNW